MIPQIINLGPLPVNSFGLMVALAIFAASIRLSKSFAVNGLNPLLAERYVFTGAISGLIGARLWYIFIDNYSDLKNDLFGAMFSAAGFTFYGGFIVASIVLFFLLLKDRFAVGKFVDSLGPALALGYAIGRLGCQLSGDGDYGIATESFLGMSYQTGVIPTPPGVLVFPTPLYESFLAILIALYLIQIESKVWWQSLPGARFAMYLLLIAGERFFVEFLRINPDVVGLLSQAQIISILIMGGAICLFALAFWRRRLASQ